jgi:hypothetical protein
LKRATEAFLGPQPVELIWSYWHEEGMLVQTMDAVSTRVQSGAETTPLGNFIRGYVQSRPQRLTARRRAYEYGHHYGLTLSGRAAPRTALFPDAFQTLLREASMARADPARAAAALGEVRKALAEGGAHNQYGDLPWTARVEMLMQQWLLAQPEVQASLPRRRTAGDEPWIASVDAMTKLQGRQGAPARHFRDLAVSGEQLLLSIRAGDGDTGARPQQAAAWARYWRPEVQRYIHAYKAVTGVSLG